MFNSLFRFPDPVSETSARLVAAAVALMGIAAIVWQLNFLIILIAYGFTARALTGPTLSPLAQIVTRVITPRLPFQERFCPGPPKRFAQSIGALLSLSSVLLIFLFHADQTGYILIAVVVFFALLEALFAFCIGCKVFALLMKTGLIPERICQRCNNLKYDLS